MSWTIWIKFSFHVSLRKDIDIDIHLVWQAGKQNVERFHMWTNTVLLAILDGTTERVHLTQ